MGYRSYEYSQIQYNRQVTELYYYHPNWLTTSLSPKWVHYLSLSSRQVGITPLSPSCVYYLLLLSLNRWSSPVTVTVIQNFQLNTSAFLISTTCTTCHSIWLIMITNFTLTTNNTTIKHFQLLMSPNNSSQNWCYMFIYVKLINWNIFI